MGNPRKRAGAETRVMALCAILSALGVILLYMGALIEVIDLSMAVLASLIVIVLVVERGGAYPWMIYAVTSVLSLLLVPNKSPAIVYTCFMGFYPILKEKLERIRTPLVRLLLKLAIFNASMVLIWFAAQMILGGIALGMSAAVALVLLNAIFVFYDYALSVMITAYLRVWRKKLRIDRFFKSE